MNASQRFIEKKISNLEIDLEAETSKGEKVKDIFCTYSPVIETVFEAATVAIKNPIAKWILALALMIINAAQEKNCPKENNGSQPYAGGLLFSAHLR